MQCAQAKDREDSIAGTNLTPCFHSTKVSVEDAPDIKSGFKIVLTFLENRFFQNTQLEKNISYLEDGTFEISSIGPQWKSGEVTHLLISHPSCQRCCMFLD